MSQTIGSQRHLFEMPDDVAYFNLASLAPRSCVRCGPWARTHSLLTLARKPHESWTEAVLAALDDRVRVVSLPNVRWTDGARTDLDRVGARARQLGALPAVDLTQVAMTGLDWTAPPSNSGWDRATPSPGVRALLRLTGNGDGAL